MTKADLVDALAVEFDLSKRQAAAMVDLVFDAITDALRAGDKVQLVPFGSFVVRDRAARTGRNPKTGAALAIAARRVAAFSAGKGLRDAVAEPKKKTAAKQR